MYFFFCLKWKNTWSSIILRKNDFSGSISFGPIWAHQAQNGPGIYVVGYNFSIVLTVFDLSEQVYFLNSFFVCFLFFCLFFVCFFVCKVVQSWSACFIGNMFVDFSHFNVLMLLQVQKRFTELKNNYLLLRDGSLEGVMVTPVARKDM